MKLINQVKILKEHGFVFIGLGGHWRRPYACYGHAKTTKGYHMVTLKLKKTTTKAQLLEKIAQLKSQVKANRDYQHKRRMKRVLRPVDGGLWHNLPRSSRAKLTLIKGAAA